MASGVELSHPRRRSARIPASPAPGRLIAYGVHSVDDRFRVGVRVLQRQIQIVDDRQQRRRHPAALVGSLDRPSRVARLRTLSRSAAARRHRSSSSATLLLQRLDRRRVVHDRNIIAIGGRVPVTAGGAVRRAVGGKPTARVRHRAHPSLKSASMTSSSPPAPSGRGEPSAPGVPCLARHRPPRMPTALVPLGAVRRSANATGPVAPVPSAPAAHRSRASRRAPSHARGPPSRARPRDAATAWPAGVQLIACVGRLAQPCVLAAVCLGILDHPLHLGRIQVRTFADRDALLGTGVAIPSRHIEDAVGVDVEGDLDLGLATRRRADVLQPEPAEHPVVRGALALALQDNDVDTGLIVFGGTSAICTVPYGVLIA